MAGDGVPAMTEAAFDPARIDVLVVEDQVPNRDLIVAFLRSMGIERIREAVNGSKGLEALERAVPDIVILDIMMPEMDGIEMLKRVRADPRFADLPVLVQTALDDREDRVRVFEAGATDLVTKPINGPELCARVRIHLENRALVGRLDAFRVRLERDLELAARTQMGLLPTEDQMESVERAYGVALHAHAEASAELGGDLWGLKPIDGNRFALWTADFSGHGVNAALNTVRLHTLMANDPPGVEEAADGLARINAYLWRMLPVDQFATMFLGVVDVGRGRIDYALAGTPGPVVCGPGEAGPRLIEDGDLPLGIREGTVYRQSSLDFPPGAQLFLFSDAMNEAPDRDGRLLGEEGVLDLVRATLAAPSERPALDRLVEGFFARTPRPPADDLTLVWLSRNE